MYLRSLLFPGPYLALGSTPVFSHNSWQPVIAEFVPIALFNTLFFLPFFNAFNIGPQVSHISGNTFAPGQLAQSPVILKLPAVPPAFTKPPMRASANCSVVSMQSAFKESTSSWKIQLFITPCTIRLKVIPPNPEGTPLDGQSAIEASNA